MHQRQEHPLLIFKIFDRKPSLEPISIIFLFFILNFLSSSNANLFQWFLEYFELSDV